MSLLSLFEEVEVKPEMLISDADRIFCEQTHEQYLKLVDQLLAYKSGIESLEKSLPKLNPATLNIDRSRPFVESNYDERENWTSDIAFTPVYAYEYLIKAEKQAIDKFNEVIILYFNSTYNLSFRTDRDNKPCDSWVDLVSRIIAHAGGSLVDAGIKNIKEAFKYQFCNKRVDRLPVLKGDTITFPYVWLLESYSDYMHFSSSNVEALLKSLTYFENQGTEIANFILRSFPTDYNDKMEYGAFRDAHPLCQKFKGFKYFKNKRLDLKFVSASAAQDFYSQFVEG